MNDNSNILCSYGCGGVAIFYVTKKNKPCCSNHRNKCPVVRAKNSAGLKASYDNQIRISGKDKYAQLPLAVKDKMAWSRNKNVYTDNRIRGVKNILCEKSNAASSRVRKLLYDLNLKERKCECCQISDWKDAPIIFELHHINGISSDNRIENLQILCPNCHSQTDNYRSLNRKKDEYKTDSEILEALKQNNFNRRKALTQLGLAPKGGNYKRLNKFII